MYYPCSKNKDVDQLRSCFEADLRLCFRIGKNLVFLSMQLIYFLKLPFGSCLVQMIITPKLIIQRGIIPIYQFTYFTKKWNTHWLEKTYNESMKTNALQWGKVLRVFYHDFIELNLRMRKPSICISDQVGHKLLTENSYKLEILDLGRGGIVLSL